MDEIALLTTEEYCKKNRCSSSTLRRRIAKKIVKPHQPGGRRTKLLIYAEPDVSQGKTTSTPPFHPQTVTRQRGPGPRWLRNLTPQTP